MTRRFRRFHVAATSARDLKWSAQEVTVKGHIGERSLRLAGCWVDLITGRVHRETEPTGQLTTRGLQLLKHLSANEGRDVGREELLREVWEYSDRVSSRATDNAIRRLREELEIDPSRPRHILTVRGVGYRFVASDTAELVRLRPFPDCFVARSAELEDIETALQTSGLVTLKGSGGIGKTRLARQAAVRFDAGPGQRAWFCELAAARDGEDIVRMVGRTLNIGVTSDGIQQIGDVLARRGVCLLVLDNFERLVEHAALIDTWRGLAPQVCFLVTSRERLRLRGERTMEIGGLPVEAAVQLMLERVAERGAVLEDTPELRALAGRLDGVPLGLELAAARLWLRPADVHALVRERLDLLRSDLREGPERHSSLAACLEWSLDLCSPSERTALAQLSVFRGGFTVEGANAVLLPDGQPVIELLQGLLDKSLLIASGGRLDLLDTIRHFVARENADPAATEARHGAHYATLGTDEAIRAHIGPAGSEKLASIYAELDNLLVARDRAVRDGRSADAVCHLRALWAALEIRGPVGLGARHASSILELPALAPADRAHALVVRGMSLQRTGRYDDALGDLLEARVLFESVALRRNRAEADCCIAANLHCLRRVQEGQSHLHAALATFRDLEDPVGEAAALAGLGRDYAKWPVGTPDAPEKRAMAILQLRRALRISQWTGNVGQEGWIWHLIGNASWQNGDLTRSRAAHEAALRLHTSVGPRTPQLLLSTLNNLGVLCAVQGEAETAVTYLERSVVLARKMGLPLVEADALANLGELASNRGHHESANRHYEDALVASPDEGQRARLTGRLAATLLDLGEAEQAAALFERTEAELEAKGSPDLAYVIATRAMACWRAGDPAVARRALRRAESLVDDTHAPYVAQARQHVEGTRSSTASAAE